MQFVLVNERMPRGSSVCACCGGQLDGGYLHAMSSSRFYCGYQCYSRNRSAGEWTFDRAGHLVQSPVGRSGLCVDWATS